MNVVEFEKQLEEAHDLMVKENYKEAVIILEKLKEIDKKSDFDYNLSHKLYQFLSNSKSLYNQQIILQNIKSLISNKKTIDFAELNNIIRETTELDIDDSIIQREVELLILRNLLTCKIEGKTLVFE